MNRLLRRAQAFYRELRRRRVIRVAAVYGGTAFVVLRLASILVGPFDLPGWTIRLVTLLLILGFPLAVTLAWVYNVTEEGFEPVGEVGDEDRKVGSAGKPFTSNAVIIGLLIVAIGLLLYRPGTGPPHSTSSEQAASAGASPADTATTVDSALANVDPASVAVLPFTYLAAEDSADYLSVGMTDEILTRLAQIEGLSVRGRTSVMRYRETEKPIPQIGRELNVAYLVEGSVQQIGDQLAIQVQLVDTRDDEHLWSSNYEGEFTNVLDLQNQVAEDVSRQLPANLDFEGQDQLTGAPEVEPQAYRLYLQARELRFRETDKSIPEAVNLVKASLERDSTFARAWALLASLSFFSGGTSGSQARRAARRAVQLDSTSAEAWTALAVSRHFHEGKLLRAAEAFERAIELNPGLANVHREHAFFCVRLGLEERAVQEAQTAVQLDPASSVAQRSLAQMLLMHDKYKKALHHFQTSARLLGRAEQQRQRFEAWTRFYLGQPRRALKTAEALGRGATVQRGFIWARLGQRDSARAVLDSLRQMAQDAPRLKRLSLAGRAVVHIGLENRDRALTLLERWANVVEFPGGPMTFYLRWVKAAPWFDPIRSEPRFEQVLRKIGLDEASLKEIKAVSTEPAA